MAANRKYAIHINHDAKDGPYTSAWIDLTWFTCTYEQKLTCGQKPNLGRPSCEQEIHIWFKEYINQRIHLDTYHSRSTYAIAPETVYNETHHGSTWVPLRQHHISGSICTSQKATKKKLRKEYTRVERPCWLLNSLKTENSRGGPKKTGHQLAHPWPALGLITLGLTQTTHGNDIDELLLHNERP